MGKKKRRDPRYEAYLAMAKFEDEYRSRMSRDALSHVDMSTDHLAKLERAEASKADQDRGSASQRESFEQGRVHPRGSGDRGTGERR
jgi:hypothetical protein